MLGTRMPGRSALPSTLLSVALTCAACGFDWTVPDEADGPGGAGASSSSGAGGSGGAGGAAQPGDTTSTASDQPGTTTGNMQGTGGDPTQLGWGTAECSDCLAGALQQGCGDPSAACQGDEGCMLLLECSSQCLLDEACLAECANGASDTSYQLFDALARCAVCELCGDKCSGAPYRCG